MCNLVWSAVDSWSLTFLLGCLRWGVFFYFSSVAFASWKIVEQIIRALKKLSGWSELLRLELTQFLRILQEDLHFSCLSRGVGVYPVQGRSFKGSILVGRWPHQLGEGCRGIEARNEGGTLPQSRHRQGCEVCFCTNTMISICGFLHNCLRTLQLALWSLSGSATHCGLVEI